MTNSPHRVVVEGTVAMTGGWSYAEVMCGCTALFTARALGDDEALSEARAKYNEHLERKLSGNPPA